MRIIAKLDVKPPFVVKPVHYEGLRKIGVPNELAKKYYIDGADEIFYIDIVASLYRREILYKEIEASCKDIFVPFAVGGGVSSIEDFSKLFHSGADKVVINSYALQENPNIIDEASRIFGSQAVVVSVEAKKWQNGYECYSDCGRIPSGKSVIEWVREVENRGAGEVLLNFVDRDGRMRGFDLELSKVVVDTLTIPVVVSSGAGSIEDIQQLKDIVNPSGVAIASILHYNKTTITQIKESLK
jgi:cyclase